MYSKCLVFTNGEPRRDAAHKRNRLDPECFAWFPVSAAIFLDHPKRPSLSFSRDFSALCKGPDAYMLIIFVLWSAQTTQSIIWHIRLLFRTIYSGYCLELSAPFEYQRPRRFNVSFFRMDYQLCFTPLCLYGQNSIRFYIGFMSFDLIVYSTYLFNLLHIPKVTQSRGILNDVVVGETKTCIL